MKRSLHKHSLMKLFTQVHWSMDAGERGIAPQTFQKGGSGGRCTFS